MDSRKREQTAPTFHHDLAKAFLFVVRLKAEADTVSISKPLRKLERSLYGRDHTTTTPAAEPRDILEGELTGRARLTY